MTEAVKSNNDLWISENDQVVLDGGPQSVQDALTDIDPESILQPTIVTNVEQPTEVEEVPEQVAPPVVVDEPEPQVITYPDGSSITIEKTNKGWKATLDSGTGAQPEVFKGATKDEMYARLAEGKLNATKKIRQLSRTPALSEEATPRTETVQALPPATPKQWTADEIFDLKAKLEDNPALAYQTWFQKETGMTPQELVNLTKTAAQKSDTAQETSQDTAVASILRDWVDITDDYLAVPENRDGMLSWLLKHKARQNPKNFNVQSALDYLYNHELLTTENLDLAWEDLKADGLATLQQAAPDPEPEQRPQVRTRTRPAAGLGIRSSETRTPARPVAEEPTSVDVTKMTEEETAEALAKLRRFKIDHPEEYERLKAIGEAKRRQG